MIAFCACVAYDCVCVVSLFVCLRIVVDGCLGVRMYAYA